MTLPLAATLVASCVSRSPVPLRSSDPAYIQQVAGNRSPKEVYARMNEIIRGGVSGWAMPQQGEPRGLVKLTFGGQGVSGSGRIPVSCAKLTETAPSASCNADQTNCILDLTDVESVCCLDHDTLMEFHALLRHYCSLPP